MQQVLSAADQSEADEILGQLLIPQPLEDPYPLLNRLREISPVIHSEATGLYFLPGFDVAHQMMVSADFGQGESAERLRSDPRFDQSLFLQFVSHNPLFIDPPDHTRLRNLVMRSFTPRTVKQLHSYVEGLVDGLLNALEEKETADVAVEFALEIPVTVICELLGVPQEDHELYQQWVMALADAVKPVIPDDMLARADEAVSGLRERFRNLIDEKRRHPAEDLLSLMVAAEEQGDRLSTEELMTMSITLLAAGTETTGGGISLGIMNMLKNPEQATLVRSRPELDADAFEEVLRFEPPVQLSFPRQAQQDVEIDGWKFAKGDIAHAMFAAANRDPSHYAEPDRLDVTRPAGQHYAFGLGIHYCLGTGLARLEGSVALPAFLRRFPDAALIEDRPAQLKGSMQIRGLTSLPVALRG